MVANIGSTINFLLGFGKFKIRMNNMCYIVPDLFERTDLIGQFKLTLQVLMLYKWVRLDYGLPLLGSCEKSLLFCFDSSPLAQFAEVIIFSNNRKKNSPF